MPAKKGKPTARSAPPGPKLHAPPGDAIAVLQIADARVITAAKTGNRDEIAQVEALKAVALFLYRGGQGAGSAAFARAARALLETVGSDSRDIFERVTALKGRAQTPNQLIATLRKSCHEALNKIPRVSHSGVLRMDMETRENRAMVFELVAGSLVSVASLPGLAGGEAPGARRRLAERIEGALPETADELMRWTLASCGVPTARIDRLTASRRMAEMRRRRRKQVSK